MRKNTLIAICVSLFFVVAGCSGYDGEQTPETNLASDASLMVAADNVATDITEPENDLFASTKMDNVALLAENQPKTPEEYNLEYFYKMKALEFGLSESASKDEIYSKFYEKAMREEALRLGLRADASRSEIEDAYVETLRTNAAKAVNLPEDSSWHDIRRREISASTGLPENLTLLELWRAQEKIDDMAKAEALGLPKTTHWLEVSDETIKRWYNEKAREFGMPEPVSDEEKILIDDMDHYAQKDKADAKRHEEMASLGLPRNMSEYDFYKFKEINGIENDPFSLKKITLPSAWNLAQNEMNEMWDDEVW